MDIFMEIADERRGLAELLSGLSAEQLATQSLCRDWTVHDVAAHLIMPMEVGLAKFGLTMLKSRGNFDRANQRLTGELAHRSISDIVEVLGQQADSRFTPPGAGPEVPLTDVLVHGLDIRWPLGVERPVPQERLRESLAFLTSGSAGVVVAKGRLESLHFEATDIDWTYGDGPTINGSADALLLAIAGRPAALDRLAGEGLPTLRSRLL